MKKIKGFIFDLDGVLTDTAHYHFLAWKRLSEQWGFTFSEHDNERLKGVDRIKSLEIILEINSKQNEFSAKEILRLANQKNEHYQQLIEMITPQDVLEGVSDFLLKSRSAEIRCAVASASKNAMRVLELLNLSNQFDFIADASAIKHPKPHPEIFLTCAQQLKLLPCECVGFEDAQAGIKSIHAAGMYSVGINVYVTSEKPMIELSSTKELNLEMIINAIEMG
ncbi:MAG: beta-phosphoglucomutase [Lachnospiraceae bacterium]|nr:beta-phosphoglucomutase [Lachnospiraceae bacterium]